MPTHASLSRLSSAILLGALAATSVAQSAVQNYGSGTAGTGGVIPDHWINSGPYLGNAGFRYTVERCRAVSFAIPAVSFDQTSLPVLGVELLLEPLQLVTLGFEITSSTGSASFPLPLPNQPALLGNSLFSQIFVLDDGSAGGFLSASQGVTLSLTLPGMVLANTSVGGSSDPQFAIDIASGTVTDFSGGSVNNSPRHTFSVDGSTAFVAQNLGTPNVQAFSTQTSTPTPLATATAQSPGFPWVLRAHPDGQRLYLIPNAPLGQVPFAEVLNADPTSANFLQPHAAGNLPMTDLLDAIAFEFDGNGDYGYAAMLGLISPNGTEVIKIDLRPASPTYHQIVDRVAMPSLMWAVTSTPSGDKLLVFVAGLGASTGSIAVIDTATMAIEDYDPVTPGTQLLGGEVSLPRTAISSDVISLAFGPRGRTLYLGGSGHVDRLVFDPTDPAYLSLTSTAVGIPTTFLWGLDVNDPGDLIYLSVGMSVEERDAATLALVRTFPTSKPLGGVVVR